MLSDSFFPISEDLGISLEDAAGLISWGILTQGVAVSFTLSFQTSLTLLISFSTHQNLFWVPTAIYLGKRPVFILSCAICFVGAIWAAASTSYGSLLGGCIFGSFGGGASEALGAAIVNVTTPF